MATAIDIEQAVLAVLCLSAGLIKLTQPRHVLAVGPMRWARRLTDGQLRAIGAFEVLAAVAVIVAAALYAPVLRTVPGAGITLALLCAIVAQSRS